jgi:hypothetical protein
MNCSHPRWRERLPRLGSKVWSNGQTIHYRKPSLTLQYQKSLIILIQLILVAVALTGPLQWLARLTLFSLVLAAFKPLRYTKLLVYTGVVVSGVIQFSVSIAWLCACRPLPSMPGMNTSARYLAGLVRPSCYRLRFPQTFLQGVTNIIVDFMLFCLPLPVIRKLQLPRRQKWGIAIVFVVALG